MAKRALLIGINEYSCGQNLSACTADATSMAEKLSRHKNGDPNFQCITCADFSPEKTRITRPVLRKLVKELFDFNGQVLFYFSGHGVLTEDAGYLCTYDAEADDWGIPMQEIVDIAMKSPASDILIMLDCCHSGDIANPKQLKGKGANPIATIRENMTVIAASRDEQTAVEAGGHGLFTAAILDALEGGAADHMGWVSAPSIYNYVERRFGAWDQRPVYKSHTQSVSVIRQCEALIDRLKLRQLTQHFPTQEFKYVLDPEHEPEDEFGKMHEPVNQEKVAVALLFKEYRDAGLLKASTQGEQLFWTARRSHTVELTPRGQEYWWLVANDKI